MYPVDREVIKQMLEALMPLDKDEKTLGGVKVGEARRALMSVLTDDSLKRGERQNDLS